MEILGRLIIALCVASGSSVLQAQLQVAEVWSTTDSPLGRLVVVDGIAEAEDGRIWVSLPRHRSVVRYSAEGEVDGVVGGEGEGAGEFELPSLIARSSVGEMVVLDQIRATLEMFSQSGIFLNRIPLNARILNPKGMAVLANGDVVLTGGSGRSFVSIHQFARNGRRRRGWFPLPQSAAGATGRQVDASRRLTAGGAVTALEDGGLLFSQAAPLQLMLFEAGDTTGMLIAEDSILPSPVDGFQPEEGRAFNWEFAQSRAVFYTPSGSVLNVITDVDNGRSIWELYDVIGELQSRTEIDQPYRIWGSAGEDFLATVADGVGVRLVRLSITYE